VAVYISGRQNKSWKTGRAGGKWGGTSGSIDAVKLVLLCGNISTLSYPQGTWLRNLIISILVIFPPFLKH